MAPNPPDQVEVEGEWIWALVEVLRNDGVLGQQGKFAFRAGTCHVGRITFEICKTQSEASAHKPQGIVTAGVPLKQFHG